MFFLVPAQERYYEAVGSKEQPFWQKNNLNVCYKTALNYQWLNSAYLFMDTLEVFPRFNIIYHLRALAFSGVRLLSVVPCSFLF